MLGKDKDSSIALTVKTGNYYSHGAYWPVLFVFENPKSLDNLNLQQASNTLVNRRKNFDEEHLANEYAQKNVKKIRAAIKSMDDVGDKMYEVYDVLFDLGYDLLKNFPQQHASKAV